MLNELLERKISEAAEWFCDNPNCGDIEDAMRELIAEAIGIENEACANVCDGLQSMDFCVDVRRAADAIRMRSNAQDQPGRTG